jgi:hypothetical protein
MLILNILKGGLLIYALVFNKQMPLYRMFFTDTYDTLQVLKEGGITIIIESLLITFNFRSMDKYKPLVFNIHDCYYWMKKVSQCFSIPEILARILDLDEPTFHRHLGFCCHGNRV